MGVVASHRTCFLRHSVHAVAAGLSIPSGPRAADLESGGEVGEAIQGASCATSYLVAVVQRSSIFKNKSRDYNKSNQSGPQKRHDAESTNEVVLGFFESLHY